MNENQEPVVFEQLADAFSHMAQAFSDFAAQAFEQVIMPVCNAMQEAYKQAGSPYGDSQEGLLMWMEVMSLANRREREPN